MRILGLKTTHDGTLALLDQGRLEFSIEQEKDSHLRYSRLAFPAVVKVAERLGGLPDVIATGGWTGIAPGYFGVDKVHRTKTKLLGRKVEMFSSSHERAHIFGSYAMSPFETGRPCYVLTWEGVLGSFYRIGAKMDITTYPAVLCGAGSRYPYLYYLAKKDAVASDADGWFRWEMPGKLMALAAGGKGSECDADERRIIDHLVRNDVRSNEDFAWLLPVNKGDIPGAAAFRDIGEQSQPLMNLAYKLSEALFDVFHRFAAAHLREGLPLIVNGGCGLNCYWNSKWRDCGLFPEVFVPPCPNDSGSAIGTAADAQYYYTGNPKISWSVYAGEEFVEDCPPPPGWIATKLDLERVAAHLKDGGVVAWVQGKYEIGPRALGNRSLLASPFEAAMTAELNRIKERESYRPIAPICLEEDVSQHFEWSGSSPYMLYFQRVRNPALCAVTHVDGSARVQTVSRDQNAPVYDLLLAFKRLSGTGVLCNTSLNFKGRGFINRTTDLIRYATETGIKLAVVNGRMFERRG